MLARDIMFIVTLTVAMAVVFFINHRVKKLQSRNLELQQKLQEITEANGGTP